MSPVSRAVKHLRELYGSVFNRMRQNEARLADPLAGRSAFLGLEQLEPRLLLDAISEVEPNNTRSAADTLIFSSNYVASVSTARISPTRSDVDYFKFTTPSFPGTTTLTVVMTPTSSDGKLDAKLWLENSSGTVLTTQNSRLDGSAETLTYSVAGSTTYYLVGASADWTDSGVGEGKYTLSVSLAPKVNTLTWRNGSSSSSSTVSGWEAGQTVYLGATATGMAGQTITVTIYEKDTLDPLGDDNYGNKTITFDSSGWGSTSWVADWDNGDGWSPYQTYYFAYSPQSLSSGNLVLTDVTAPFAPSGLAVNATSGPSTTRTFSWNTTTDNPSNTLGSGFKEFVLKVNGTERYRGTATSKDLSGLAAGNYTWLVEAWDNNGKMSSTSGPAFSVGQVNTLTWRNGSSSSSGTVSSWEAGQTVYLGATATGMAGQTITVTIYEKDTLDPLGDDNYGNKTITFDSSGWGSTSWVADWDNGDGWSPYQTYYFAYSPQSLSSGNLVLTDVTAPFAPSGLAVNATSGPSTTRTFSWNTTTDNPSNTLGSGFKEFVLKVNGTERYRGTATSKDLSGLAAGNYTWLVEAWDNNGKMSSTSGPAFSVGQVNTLTWRNGSSSSSGTVSSWEAGQTVYLGATATGMAGQTITVTIYEKDTLDPLGDDNYGNKTITFDSSGWGSTSWVADWDNGDGFSPYQTYYFRYSPQDLYSGNLVLTDVTAPFAPSGLAVNATSGPSTTRTFSWNTTTDNPSNTLGSGFKEFVLKVNGTERYRGTATSKDLSGLAAGNYTWLVEAWDNNGKMSSTSGPAFSVGQVNTLTWRNGSSSSSGTVSSWEAGQTVYLGATATGMAGQTITVTIYEKDTLDPLGDDNYGNKTITFDSSGWGSTSWVADWDNGDGFSPYQTYYFRYSPQDLYSGNLVLTDVTAPFAPSGLAVNATSGPSTTRTFSWNTTTDNPSNTLGSGFKEFVLKVNGTERYRGTATSKDLSGLAAGNYTWLVEAWDNNGKMSSTSGPAFSVGQVNTLTWRNGSSSSSGTVSSWEAGQTVYLGATATGMAGQTITVTIYEKDTLDPLGDDNYGNKTITFDSSGWGSTSWVADWDNGDGWSPYQTYYFAYSPQSLSSGNLVLTDVTAPFAPSGLAVNATSGPSTTRTFSWNTTTDNPSNTLGSGFKEFVLKVNGTERYRGTATSKDLSGLAAGNYTWLVEAWDNNGKMSSTSGPAFSVGQVNTLTWRNGSSSSSGTVSSWEAGQTVYLGATATGMAGQTITVTIYEKDTLDPLGDDNYGNKTITFDSSGWGSTSWVADWDNGDGWSPYQTYYFAYSPQSLSSGNLVLTDVTAPFAPSGLAVNATSGPSTTRTFSWNTTTDNPSNTLGSGFKEFVLKVNGTERYRGTATSKDLSGLAAGNYTWLVEAWDNNGKMSSTSGPAFSVGQVNTLTWRNGSSSSSGTVSSWEAGQTVYLGATATGMAGQTITVTIYEKDTLDPLGDDNYGNKTITFDSSGWGSTSWVADWDNGDGWSPYQTYYFAYSPQSLSSGNLVLTDVTAPFAPSGLAVNATSGPSTTRTFSWNTTTDNPSNTLGSGFKEFVLKVNGTERYRGTATSKDLSGLAAGNYTWLVEAWDNNGKMSSTSGPAFDVSLPYADALWLELDHLGKTSVSGSISGSLEQKLYRLVPDASGTAVIETETPGSDLDTLLALYNASGKRLQLNDDASLIGTDSKISYSLTAGTTYYVLVSGKSGSTGTFTLNVDAANAALTTVKLAANIARGKVTGESISPAGEGDYFQVVAPANTAGGLKVKVDSQSKTLNAKVTVWEKNLGWFGLGIGKTTIEKKSAQGTGINGDPSVFIGASAGYTYYIRVTGAGGSTGTYDLHVEFSTDDLPDSLNNARLVGPNAQVPARIDTAGDKDVVAINARGGIKYTLTVGSEGKGSVAGGSARVFNSNKTVVASTTWTRGTDQKVSFTASVDDVYYIQYAANSSTALGTYHFEISPSKATPPGGDWGSMWTSLRDWANDWMSDPQDPKKPLFFFDASVAFGVGAQFPYTSAVEGHLVEAGVTVAFDLADLAGLTLDAAEHYTTVWLMGSIAGPGFDLEAGVKLDKDARKLQWGPFSAGLGIMTLDLVDANKDGFVDANDDPAQWDFTKAGLDIGVGPIHIDPFDPILGPRVSLKADDWKLYVDVGVSLAELLIPILRADVPTSLLFGPMNDLLRGTMSGQDFLGSMYKAMTSFFTPPRNVNLLGIWDL